MLRTLVIPTLAAVLIGAVLAVIPVAAPPAAATELPPMFSLTWGTYGAGNAQFQNPYFIATDAAGNVYVADRGNNRVQKFNSAGSYLTQWGGFGTGNGQFRSPAGVATDSAGNVYVADSNNNRVQKFTSTGSYLTQWGGFGTGNGQLSLPLAAATDSAGNVYVTDSNNNRVQKFTSTGSYLTQWGGFNHPLGVATDSVGNVYVTESHRVQKFTSTGSFLTEWGSYGSGNGQFATPWGIAADDAGGIYVADYYNQRTQKFTSTGTYVSQWGSYGNGHGEFYNPVGVAVDRAGAVYVAERDNHRVQKFMPAVTGTVTETGSGAPLGGVWVAVLRTTDFSIAGAAVADAAGGFEAAVASGSYYLYVVDPSGRHQSGFYGSPATVTVAPGQATAVNPQVAPLRGTISGAVSEEGSGTALDGTWALALSTGMADSGALEKLAITSDGGRYRLEDLGSGTHFVGWLDPTGNHATRFFPDSPNVPHSTRVMVSAGGNTIADGGLPAQTPTEREVTLAGQVIESESRDPLADVYVVILNREDYRMAAGVVTDARGEFSAGVARGEYFVAFLDSTATHRMEWFDDQPSTGLEDARPVTAPGEIRADLDRSTGDIVGTVLDESSGTPPAGMWVLAIGPTGLAGGAITAADGTYTLADLAPGTYRVTFADPVGGRTQEFWDDATGYEGATPFPVQAGTVVTRNAELHLAAGAVPPATDLAVP